MSIDEQLVLQPFERKPFVLNLVSLRPFLNFGIRWHFPIWLVEWVDGPGYVIWIDLLAADRRWRMRLNPLLSAIACIKKGGLKPPLVNLVLSW